MTPTPLTRQVAANLVDYIRDEQIPPGTRLVERTLAEQLRVSRSPVRSAMPIRLDRWIRSDASASTAQIPSRAGPFAAQSREDPVQ